MGYPIERNQEPGRELGQAWLKKDKGFYDHVKEARITRERERDNCRMMRECRTMFKMIGEVHGIENMQDMRTLEAERKKRIKQEEMGRRRLT